MQHALVMACVHLGADELTVIDDVVQVLLLNLLETILIIHERWLVDLIIASLVQATAKRLVVILLPSLFSKLICKTADGTSDLSKLFLFLTLDADGREDLAHVSCFHAFGRQIIHLVLPSVVRLASLQLFALLRDLLFGDFVDHRLQVLFVDSSIKS